MAITDGSVVCGHCGEWRTTCPLCIGEERLVNMTSTLVRERREADRGLDQQSAAIKEAIEALIEKGQDEGDDE